MKFKAVITDLDGIIVNSEPVHFLSFQKMLEMDYGISYTKEDDENFLGTTDQNVFAALKKRYPQIKTPLTDLIRRRTEVFISLFKTQAKPRAGIGELLNYFKSQNIPLAVGTAASRGVVEFILNSFKFRNFFKTIVCADDLAHGKPAPDTFLEIAKRLNVSPKDCLVLEDSLCGVQAAKAAGMTCIAIPCGPTLSQDLSAADFVLKNLSDVTPVLQTLTS